MLSLREFRQRQRVRYEKQRSIADKNRLKYGRDSREPGVYFYRNGVYASPWCVCGPRIAGRQSTSCFLTEHEAIIFHQSQPYCSCKEEGYAAANTRITRSTLGYRGCIVRKMHNIPYRIVGVGTTKRKCSSAYFPFTNMGLLAAALWHDEISYRLHGKYAVPNFLSDGRRNPASMTHADGVLWTKGEYVEPILSLSAAEKKELVALLAAKDVPVPAYLKPKKKKRPSIKVA